MTQALTFVCARDSSITIYNGMENKNEMKWTLNFLQTFVCFKSEFNAIKDFDSLSQTISQSVILNIFKRNIFKFVI